MEKDTLDGEEPLLVTLSAELHWANGIVLSSSSIAAQEELRVQDLRTYEEVGWVLRHA